MKTLRKVMGNMTVDKRVSSLAADKLLNGHNVFMLDKMISAIKLLGILVKTTVHDLQSPSIGFGGSRDVDIL